jgi:peptide/nickel transport system substrate-binding protein
MAKRNFKWNAFERLKIKQGSFSARAKNTETATLNHARHFVVSRWENTHQIRRHMALWLIGVGLLIAAAAVQFNWFSNAFMVTASANGGTYAEGNIGDINTLNPLYASTQSEQSLARLIFSSLFVYDNNGSLRGDLAQTIKTQDGGKRYVVEMRRGLVWQDGRAVTARDIAFTINLIKKPEVGSPLLPAWADIDVKTLDDSTIQFDLSSAYAPFPHALTFPVLPEHILTKVDPSTLRENIFSQKPLGSGPFNFDSVQNIDGKKQRKIVRLSQNVRYYRSLPKIERIQLHTFETQDDLFKSMLSGELSAASGLSMSELNQLNSNRFNISSVPVNSAVYALFNTSRGPLADKKVRQALQLGTNTDDIIKSYPVKLNGIDTPFTEDQVGSDDLKKPKFNQAKAKKMLDDAGWRLKDGTVRKKGKETLEIEMVTVKDPDYDSVTNKVAEQWRSLGLKVKIQSVDTSDPSQNLASMVLQPRNYDVLVYELALGADPDSFAYWHSSQADGEGLNLSNYKDDISDDILVSARSRVDGDLREAKYRSFATRWLETVPAIGLYQSDLVYVSKPNVSSIASDARLITPYDRFNNVENWTVREGSVYKTP